MIEALLKNQTIADFIVLYPKSQWRRWIEHTLEYGIKSLSDAFPKHLSIADLQSLAESRIDSKNTGSINTKFQSMRVELEELNQALSRQSQASSPKRASPRRSSPKRHNRNNSLSRSSLHKEYKQRSHNRNKTPRGGYKTIGHSPERCTRLVRAERKQKRLIPKKLQNVQSKIKDAVKQDLATYKRRPQNTRYRSPEGSARNLSTRNLKSSGRVQESWPEAQAPMTERRRVQESWPETQAPMTERRTQFLQNDGWFNSSRTPNLEESSKFLREYKQDPVSTKYETSMRRESDLTIEQSRSRNSVQTIDQPRSRQSVQTIDQPRSRESLARDTGELLGIAEDFLRDPLMLHLSQPDYAITFGGAKSPNFPSELKRSCLDNPSQEDANFLSINAVRTVNTPSPSLSYEYTYDN